MKNQSFHPRKIRIQETPELDYDQLISRTMIALNRLGQQRFSNEPGGYSLDNWTKGVNILLDDFEEKLGEGKLTTEYLTKRSELKELLSKPVLYASIDRDISETRQKMIDPDRRIEAEKSRIASRIAELKDNQTKWSAELAQKRAEVPDLDAENHSGSFFRRLLAGNPKSQQKDSAVKVEELESRLSTLTTELLELQKLLKLIERRSLESPFAEDWKELETLRTRLEALENERLMSIQLVKEREGITSSIAAAISKIPT
jgi:chromosome segregation ATPase